MLTVKRQSQMNKVKAALREAVRYADEIAADKRLHADLRAAMEHGVEARDRIRKDFDANSIATRLANDRKLRKKLQLVLDDLDSASDRLLRRQRHRLRNQLLLLGGIGAVTAAAIPSVRHWIAGLASAGSENAADVGMSV